MKDKRTNKEAILVLINEYLLQNGITMLHTIDEIGDLYEEVFNPELDIMFQYPTIYVESGFYIGIDGKIN